MKNETLLRVCFSILLLISSLVMCTIVTASVAQAAPAPPALSGNYIVVLKDDASAPRTKARLRTSSIQSIARTHGARITGMYSSALNGFAASGVTAAGLAALKADRAVEMVVPDVKISLSDREGVQQANPTWGLDRIDQRKLPLNHRYSPPSSAGKGVRAYVIDSGVQATHSEFKGRVATGYDVIDRDNNPDDCRGHGTHVAATIGGTTYGVAKKVTIVPVRALDCKGAGSIGSVIAAIDWVTQTHRELKDRAVANMSISIPRNAALDKAVQASINSGILYSVAAGNYMDDACKSSPNTLKAPIVVGATSKEDEFTFVSNWGACVDILAPGQDITSAWIGTNTTTNTISGTSMAAPHVTGAAALTLAGHPTYTPAKIRQIIISNATTGAVSQLAGDTPNKLLYTSGK